MDILTYYIYNNVFSESGPISERYHSTIRMIEPMVMDTLSEMTLKEIDRYGKPEDTDHVNVMAFMALHGLLGVSEWG